MSDTPHVSTGEASPSPHLHSCRACIGTLNHVICFCECGASKSNVLGSDFWASRPHLVSVEPTTGNAGNLVCWCGTRHADSVGELVELSPITTMLTDQLVRIAQLEAALVSSSRRAEEIEEQRDTARKALNECVSPPDANGVRSICLGYHEETQEYEWLEVIPAGSLASLRERIKTPRVPNYVFLDGLHEGAKIGVEHLTEDQLRAVGAAFTVELIAAAKRRSVNGGTDHA